MRPWRLRLRPGAALLLLAALSACAIPDGRRVPVAMEAEASGTPPMTASAEATVRRPPPVVAPPVVAPASTATATIPPDPMEAKVDPARILGLDRTGVAALLGEPALIRRDSPAEVWQYHGTGCVLDLFLYDAPDNEPGGDHRVAYVEARTGAAEPAPAERCITRLLTARPTPRTS